jgi:hypothetical protein
MRSKRHFLIIGSKDEDTDGRRVVVTVVAFLAVIFNDVGLIRSVSNYQLPDVDSTVVATFGLGAGAYLTQKSNRKCRHFL